MLKHSFESSDGRDAVHIADKAVALLTALGPADLERIPPAERRRLADICRRVADLAEPRPAPPTAGVLASLRNGERMD
jgi:hypothetical protein